jgi:hypothetical protein
LSGKSPFLRLICIKAAPFVARPPAQRNSHFLLTGFFEMPQ